MSTRRNVSLAGVCAGLVAGTAGVLADAGTLDRFIHAYRMVITGGPIARGAQSAAVRVRCLGVETRYPGRDPHGDVVVRTRFE